MPAATRRPDGPRRRPSPTLPSEPALLYGLLCDLLLLPFWLLGLALGRSRLRDGLRPLLRVQRFISAAPMTALLAGLNLLVFTVEVFLRASGMAESALLHHFALRRQDLQSGHYSTLLTHVFAHASVGHLAGNLLALVVFGRVVERHLGAWRLLAAYLLAAIGSTAMSLLAQLMAAGQPSVPTLGASGAVAGLVALGVLFEPFTITFESLLPLPLFLVGWLTMATDLLALWRGGQGHDPVDHPAHLGGYLSVLLFYLLLDRRQQQRAQVGLLINLATALLALTLWHLAS
jgi:membrane associated rhomboid family serine protease